MRVAISLVLLLCCFSGQCPIQGFGLQSFASQGFRGRPGLPGLPQHQRTKGLTKEQIQQQIDFYKKKYNQ
jgi:hypothetical protein